MQSRIGFAIITLCALSACSGETSGTTKNLGTSQKNDAGDEDQGEDGGDAPDTQDDGGDAPGEDAGASAADAAGGQESDAGSTGGEDAGAVAMDGATSSNDAATPGADTSVPDAGVSDAGTTGNDSGAQADAGPGAANFTIQVRRLAQPIANALIVEHNADLSLRAQGLTGSDGVYSSAAAPAALTAVVLRSTPPELPTDVEAIVTWYDLAQGDHLVLELEAPGTAGDFAPAYAASFGAPGAGAAQVRVLAGPESCGAGVDNSAPLEGPATVNWYSGCARGTGNALLGVAYNAAFAPTAFSFLKNAPAIGAGAQAVTLGEWQAPGSMGLSVSNLPSDRIAALSFVYGAAGLLFDPSQPLRSLASGSAQRSAQLPYPAGFADFHQLTLQLPLSAEGWLRTLSRRQESSSTSMALDWSTALPGATSASYAPTPTPVYTYTAAPGAENADGVAVRLRWAYRSNQIEGPQIPIDWLLIAPPARTQLPMPALPPNYPALGSGANFANFQHSVGHFGSTLQDGYRAFLREPARLEPVVGRHALQRALEATGELQGTTYLPPLP